MREALDRLTDNQEEYSKEKLIDMGMREGEWLDALFQDEPVSAELADKLRIKHDNFKRLRDRIKGGQSTSADQDKEMYEFLVAKIEERLTTAE